MFHRSLRRLPAVRLTLLFADITTPSLPSLPRTLSPQVAWATSAGVGNGGRRLFEPAGTRGGLTLHGCGPDSASDGFDAGEEAHPRRPAASSALTASAPYSEAQGQGQVSELMLEFRLTGPDASVVVGSVGPPPMAAEGGIAPATVPAGANAARGDERGRGGRGRGISENSEARESGDAGTIGPWAVTRQSEWVEARPRVYASLISCASPDPGSLGFWFWCVASRVASPLSDCGPRASRAAGHGCLLGQMMIDLRPVAVVWNRCSQPLRAILTCRSRVRGWLERPKASETPQRVAGEKHESGGGGTEGVTSLPRRDLISPYQPSGSTAAIPPGGRMAVCQQPFVDYDLELASPEHAEGGAGGDARPFLVSVPSELLSRRCVSSWLPLHSRALMDNVLCPLVVVASRLLDAHWPSLSLRIYPGLSVQNHMPVPLSLRAVFTQPLLDTAGTSGQEDSPNMPVVGRGERDQVNPTTEHDQQPDTPLLRRVDSDANVSPSLRGGRGGDGNGGSSGGDSTAQDSFTTRMTRIIRAPAESRHSAWDMYDNAGFPVPFLLPALTLEIGLVPDEEGEEENPMFMSPGREFDSRVTGTGPAGSRSADYSVIRRSRTLKVALDEDLSEVVLIPWGTRGGAVIPTLVKLEREAVLGGVELIRVEVHPRVVVHNATGLPVSLSLLGAQTPDPGDNQESDAILPVCRVHLAPEGRGSSMTVLAFPEKWASVGPSGKRHGYSGAGGSKGYDSDTSDEGAPADSHVSGGLRGTLSWLLGSTSYNAAPTRPPGFSVDLEVSFRLGGPEESPTASALSDGAARASVGSPTLEAVANGGVIRRRPTAVSETAVMSLREAPGGGPLHCEPSSLMVMADDGRRTMRIWVAVEPPSTDASPTRHVLLHHPQPSLIVNNRSTTPVTLVFDCGASLEVGAGGTAEHSWQNPERDRGSSTGAGSAARLSHRSAPSTPQSRRRGSGMRSRATSEASSPSGSPAASMGGSGMPARRRSHGSGPGGSPAPGKVRPPGKIGRDATLQHWFQCKGGSQHDESLQWSDPLWVARGVQVIRFDGDIAEEGLRGGYSGDDEGWGHPVRERKARELQVHVIERAGGFVMSFAEGGFDDIGATADSSGGGGADTDEQCEGGDVATKTRWGAILVGVSLFST